MAQRGDDPSSALSEEKPDLGPAQGSAAPPAEEGKRCSSSGRDGQADVGVVPGEMRAMSLSFATNEILGLITHDPLPEDDFPV